MTHTQKWLTIAEAFATEPKHRTREQKTITASGLCHAAFYAYMDGWTRIERLGRKMRHDGFWWPTYVWHRKRWSRKHDLLRSTFACFMAAMTERDFNYLLEG